MEVTENSNRRQLLAVFAIVVLVATGAYFWQLGKNAIGNSDEGIHAVVTRAIRENGDWLTLQFRGKEYFRKPPLSFWVRAATQSVLGESEFTTRLPSALAGVGTTFLLAWWAWLWTRRAAASLIVGIIFPLLPMTFTHTFRSGETDGILIFLLTLSAFLFWQSLKRPWLVVAAAAAVGFAFMTKSVAAGVVPIGFTLALLLTRRWPYSWKHVLIAVLAFLMVVVPWHAYELVEHGQTFWKEYVEFHILQRVEERLHTTPKSHGPFWYIRAVESGMFPWSWLLVPAFAFGVWRARRGVDGDSTSVFLTTWGLGTVLLFSLAATKLAWYVAPAYPAFTLLIARFITELPRGIPRWLWIVTEISLAGYFLRAFQLFRTGVSRFLSLDPLDPVKGIVLIVLVVVVVLFFAYQRSRRLGAQTVRILVLLVFLHLSLASSVVFTRNMRKTYESPFRVFRNAIVALDPRAEIYVYHLGYITSPLTQIYLVGERWQRTVTALRENNEKFQDILRTKPGAFIIFDRKKPPDPTSFGELKVITTYDRLSLYRVRAME